MSHENTVEKTKEHRSKSGFRITSVIIAAVMLIGAFGVLIGPFTLNVAAAPDTHIWDGGGANALASTPENWVSDIAPEALDSVVWNAGALPCTWDLPIALNSWSMNSDYTGVITQAASFSVTSYSQAVGTFTGSTSYVLSCSGDFVRGADAGFSAAVTNLVMSGDGKYLNGTYVNLYSLSIAGSTTITGEVHLETGSIFSVSSGKTLTLESTGSLTLRTYATFFSFSNSGTIAGSGNLILWFNALSRTITFGDITVPTEINLLVGTSASRTCTIGGASSFNALWVRSAHASYTMTFSGNSDSTNLLGIKYLTVGQGGVFRGGAANVSIHSVNITSLGAFYGEEAAFTISGDLTMAPGAVFDINNATTRFANTDVVKLNPYHPLITPTYDGSGQGIHPNIVYFPDGWHGYKYWMAMTPFPAGQSEYENPSILTSNDGIYWVVPPGLTNPLEPKPSGEGNHNYDPEMLYNDATDELWLWYGSCVNPTSYQYFKKSSDGITWSTKVATDPTGIGMTKIMIGDTIYSWYISAASEVTRVSSTDGIAWASAGVGSISGSIPNGQVPWHYDVLFDASHSKYWLLMSVAEPISGNTWTNMTFAYSDDGLAWTLQSGYLIVHQNNSANYRDQFWDSYEVYKATGVIDDGFFRIWYCGKNRAAPYSWFTGYTVAEYTYSGTTPIVSSTRWPIIHTSSTAYILKSVDIPVGSKIILSGKLTITDSLSVSGTLYAPDEEVRIAPLVGSTINIFGDLNGCLNLTGVSAPIVTLNMRGLITNTIYVSNKTIVITDGTHSFSMSTNIVNGVRLDISSYDPSASIVASWTATGFSSTGATTFTLSGLDSSVGYKVYVDGKELMRQHSGHESLTFSYAGPWSEHEFTVEAWSPYGILMDTGTLLFIMASILVLAIAILLVVEACTKRVQRLKK